MRNDTRPLLSVRNLRTSIFQDEGTTKAVDGASFDVSPGKTLGIVGESGCGKSVTAQSILRIVDRPGRIVDGEIVLTRADGSQTDLTKLEPNGREMRSIRGGDIGLVFQEPMTSFSPVHTIGAQLIEAVLLHNAVSKKEARRRGIEALRSVGVEVVPRDADAALLGLLSLVYLLFATKISDDSEHQRRLGQMERSGFSTNEDGKPVCPEFQGGLRSPRFRMRRHSPWCGRNQSGNSCKSGFGS